MRPEEGLVRCVGMLRDGGIRAKNETQGRLRGSSGRRFKSVGDWEGEGDGG
jgi:hypothetical protein